MFVVRGGHPLRGRVSVSGAKNAALPIMAASLASRGDHVIAWSACPIWLTSRLYHRYSADRCRDAGRTPARWLRLRLERLSTSNDAWPITNLFAACAPVSAFWARCWDGEVEPVSPCQGDAISDTAQSICI